MEYRHNPSEIRKNARYRLYLKAVINKNGIRVKSETSTLKLETIFKALNPKKKMYKEDDFKSCEYNKKTGKLNCKVDK